MINQLDLNKIPEYPSIVLAGKRRSGKGVMTKDLVFNVFRKRKLTNAFLFSPTSNIAQNGMEYIPENNRFNNLDLEVIQVIMERQETLIKDDPKGNYHILLVIDDIVGSINSKQKAVINQLFILGRHLQISLIFNVQSIKNEFSPTMRQNTDLIFIFNQSNYFNKEQLAFEYLSISMDKKEGIKLIDKYAVEHQSLVILNTNKTGLLKDYVFFYKAEHPIKSFLLKF